MSEIPDNPRHTVVIDLKEQLPTDENILVLTDCRSRFPVTSVLKTTTANTIIISLLKIFTTFVYTKCITTDNGSQFKQITFKNFLKQHNIKLRVVTPYTKSKFETHSEKLIRRNTFQFPILSTKNQMKGLRNSYSPKNHHKG